MYYTFELTELTPEEQAEAKRISNDFFLREDELLKKRESAFNAGKDTSKIDAELSELMSNDPYRLFLEKAEQRHFSLFNGNTAAIYDDAIERLPKLIKRNYKGLLVFIKSQDAQNVINEDKIDDLLSVDAMMGRVKYSLTMHLEALRKDNERYKRLLMEIQAQVKDYKANYDVETAEDPAQLSNDIIPAFYGSVLSRQTMPSFHGKTSDAFFGITSSLIKNNVDPIANGKSKFDIHGVHFEIEKAPVSWGLNEKMLFLVIRSQLTENNPSQVQPVKNTSVSIPLKAYGEFRGIHVTADKMDTEEEQAKENKRVSTNLKNLRRAVRANLDNMQILKFKGPNGTGAASTIIPDYVVSNDYITVNLRQEFADAIVKEAIEYIPISIGKIPNKNQNSDNILALALKLLERNTNFNNYRRRDVDPEILSVKTLIGTMKITTYKDLEKRNDTRHWQREIKDKLDDALDMLHNIGFLGEYSYCKAKGAELTDAEYNEMLIAGYQAYEALNVKFSIKDTVVFMDQLEAWKEKTDKKVKENKKKAAKRDKK